MGSGCRHFPLVLLFLSGNARVAVIPVIAQYKNSAFRILSLSVSQGAPFCNDCAFNGHTALKRVACIFEMKSPTTSGDGATGNTTSSTMESSSTDSPNVESEISQHRLQDLKVVGSGGGGGEPRCSHSIEVDPYYYVILSSL